VEVEAGRRGVLWEADGSKPHHIVLNLLSTGNRAAVVRDIRLVTASGDTLYRYRGFPIRSEPRLPLRLEAPDEWIATLELTDEEEGLLSRIEVDLINESKPIAWPYKRMSASGEGKGDGRRR
jgi:hypothetical protein